MYQYQFYVIRCTVQILFVISLTCYIIMLLCERISCRLRRIELQRHVHNIIMHGERACLRGFPYKLNMCEQLATKVISLEIFNASKVALTH